MTDTYSLTLSRIFDAPPGVVFDAWVHPAHIRRWYPSVPDAPGTEAVVDLRPGGSYRISWLGDDGSRYTEAGEFIEVQPPARLVYTMRFEDDFPEQFESRVTVVFAESGGKTRLELTHEGYPSAEMRDAHERGWPSFLDRLAAVVASLQAAR
jgi:uncharacterized protein YndB with AHSA1/START domain